MKTGRHPKGVFFCYTKQVKVELSLFRREGATEAGFAGI